jgi:hypothetical protein
MLHWLAHYWWIVAINSALGLWWVLTWPDTKWWEKVAMTIFGVPGYAIVFVVGIFGWVKALTEAGWDRMIQG